MRKIIFVNRFFYPDQSATSRMLSDLAFALASQGMSISVITTRGLYNDPDEDLPAREDHEGVTIHRVYRPRFSRGKLLGRALDYIAMYFAFGVAVLRHARRGDRVVAKTDPPLLSVVLAPVAALKGLALVNWLQDIYPEIAVVLGLRALKPVAPVLRLTRDISLRMVRRNVVISERMRDLVAATGATRINMIENWCNDAAITPLAPEQNALRRQWGLADAFVVGYSGNLGRTHEYATLLEAASRLRGHNGIRFLFIGGGHLFNRLKQDVRARGLAEAFLFLPYQPDDMLTQSLSVPDIHWLSQPAEMEGLILPSKFYGIAAVGRPILVIGNPEGELAQRVERQDCGAAIATNDAARLATLILDLRSDARRREEMGANARRMLDENFSRREALAKWRALLERI